MVRVAERKHGKRVDHGRTGSPYSAAPVRDACEHGSVLGTVGSYLVYILMMAVLTVGTLLALWHVGGR